MHPNPAFRNLTDPQVIDFARDRGFGILSVNGDDGPLAAHVPFLLSPDGTQVELHLARSNPVGRALAQGQPVLLAVPGADAYVSPDWYGLEDQVPTWNYLAAHIRGVAVMQPAETLRAHLDRLSDHFEARLAPKPVWKTAKLPGPVLDRLMRMIVPCTIRVTGLTATQKLSQNKPAEARIRAGQAMAAGSAGLGGGLATGLIAALMQATDV